MIYNCMGISYDDIHNRDNERIKFLTDIGYKVMIIWELDYNTGIDLIKEINENCK